MKTKKWMLHWVKLVSRLSPINNNPLWYHKWVAHICTHQSYIGTPKRQQHVGKGGIVLNINFLQFPRNTYVTYPFCSQKCHCKDISTRLVVSHTHSASGGFRSGQKPGPRGQRCRKGLSKVEHVEIWRCINIYIYVCVCKCIYQHIYIYIHTYQYGKSPTSLYIYIYLFIQVYQYINNIYIYMQGMDPWILLCTLISLYLRKYII